MYYGGKEKKTNSRFGEGYISGGRGKKEILDFEQDVLRWEGEKNRFQIWGRMDVLLGEGKKTKFQIWGMMYYWGKGKKSNFRFGE
jgi:hypothetical protein